MTVNKSDLVQSTIENVRFKPRKRTPQTFLFPEMDCVFLTRKRATEIIDTLFETMKRRLVQGEDIRISGFGKFQPKFRWTRRGRHPRTGETLIIPSRRIVTFQASPKLRARIDKPTAE